MKSVFCLNSKKLLIQHTLFINVEKEITSYFAEEKKTFSVSEGALLEKLNIFWQNVLFFVKRWRRKNEAA